MAVGFSLSGTELRGNEGRTQQIDLYEAYLDNAQDSLADEWEVALHADGTGAGGRSMIGLGGALPIIPTQGTYGGISRATNAIWQPSVFNAASDFTALGATGWDSTTARPILENIVARRSKGRRYASIAIADLKAYQALSASMVAHQRIQERNGSEATLGFRGLEVATPVGNVTVYCATGVGAVMPANTIYGIDPQGIEVRYMSDYNIVPLFPGEGAQPVNQDAYAQYILWVGELILRNPRFCWRLVATPTP